jgi:hypothetical protein
VTRARAESIISVEMIKRFASASPRFAARIAGVLYLIIFIAAPSGAENATLAKIAITLACDTGYGAALLLFTQASRQEAFFDCRGLQAHLCGCHGREFTELLIGFYSLG